MNFSRRIQWGLEYRTRSDFGWSKAVPLANGSVFKWFGQNGCHFVWISNGFVRFSNVRFSNGRFQYIDDGTGMAGTDHSKSEPSQYRTWKRSVFEWIRYSNVRYSSPHCILEIPSFAPSNCCAWGKCPRCSVLGTALPNKTTLQWGSEYRRRFK